MKKVSMALVAVSALSFAMAAGSADAQIYQALGDSTNQIGFSYNGGASGVGNTITFAGSGPFSLGSVDLFGYAGGGSLPIEVSIYAGADPNTGALLGSEQYTPAGNGNTTEVLNFGGLTVPDTVTYIVSIVGNTGSFDDSFVDWQQYTGNTGAPTIGTSTDMWYGAPGSYVVDNSYAIDTGAKTNTLGVQFNVPDGGTTLVLLGLAVAGLAGLRRKLSA
jgi:hypothetical protein